MVTVIGRTCRTQWEVTRRPSPDTCWFDTKRSHVGTHQRPAIIRLFVSPVIYDFAAVPVDTCPRLPMRSGSERASRSSRLCLRSLLAMTTVYKEAGYFVLTVTPRAVGVARIAASEEYIMSYLYGLSNNISIGLPASKHSGERHATKCGPERIRTVKLRINMGPICGSVITVALRLGLRPG